jgi:FkbM family methyltransferase
MLLDFDQLVARYQIPRRGVVHVGAHIGEEAECYERNGIHDVTWVEANPEVVPRLRAQVEPYGHRVVEALLADRAAEIPFHITNNQQSSSILELGRHRHEHPEVVVTETILLRSRTLDELCEAEHIGEFPLLVMDIQGAELLVLKGAAAALAQVDYLYLEVSEQPLYIGSVVIAELDEHLSDFSRSRRR